MTEIENLASAVTAASSTLEPVNLNATFFSNRSSKFLDLTSDTPAETPLVVKVGPQGYEYILKSPALIETIELTGEGSAKRPSIKVDALSIDGKTVSVRTRPDAARDNVLVADVNEIVRGLKISAEGWGVLSKTHKITAVSVRGHSLQDIKGIEESLYKFFDALEKFNKTSSGTLDEIRDAEDKLAAAKKAFQGELTTGRDKQSLEAAAHKVLLEEDEKNHQTKLSAIEAEVQKAGEILEKQTGETKSLRSEIEQQRAEVQHLGDKFLMIQSETEQAQKKHDDLLQRTSEKDSELKLKTDQATALNDKLQRLNSDVSLFADNMIGFTRQGASQIRTYMFWIVAPCLVITAVLTVFIMIGAWKLVDTFTNHPGIKVTDLILLRTPTVFAAASVFGFLSLVAKPFLRAIREINMKRLALSEISILAGDVSDSALYGQSVTPEEKTELRLKVRMQLVREYFTGNFSKPEHPSQKAPEIEEDEGLDANQVGLSKAAGKIVEKAIKAAAPGSA
jgi:hypothetical protein